MKVEVESSYMFLTWHADIVPHLTRPRSYTGNSHYSGNSNRQRFLNVGSCFVSLLSFKDLFYFLLCICVHAGVHLDVI